MSKLQIEILGTGCKKCHQLEANAKEAIASSGREAEVHHITDTMIPSEWVVWAVGGNSLFANFFAAIAGAFMYFATLTEVPILQGLIGNGMGQGPALALLLAGPALSLPNMLVIHSIAEVTLGLPKQCDRNLLANIIS